MPEPIYKLWAFKYTEAWYQSSESRRQEMMARLEEARDQTDNKLMIAADPTWSSEQYSFCGIDEFPDFASVKAFAGQLNEVALPRYVNSSSILGTSIQPPVAADAKNQIVKLFMLRPTAAWYQLSEDDQNGIMAKLGTAIDTVGGQGILYCNSSWSSERWQMFGAEVFPDIDAVQRLGEIHTELDWYQYIDSKTMLGTLA